MTHTASYYVMLFSLCFSCFFCNSVSGQADSLVVKLSKPDSAGWIRLYNGSNDSDFYTFYKDRVIKSFPDATFKRTQGDTIRASGSPTGHVIFKQHFSHYQIRYQSHYPNNKQGNAGMLIHLQPDDPLLSSTFPRSLESQGDPDQGMGQLWCISNVWVTVRAKSDGTRPVYDPKAGFIIYGAAANNKRVIAGIEGWAMPKLTLEQNNLWSEMLVEVHGSDSITHYINGKEMIRYYHPRVAPANDTSKVEKFLSSGQIAWQSEGVPILYRNIEIKLYPEDPLYKKVYLKKGCTDPAYGEYDSTAFVDDGSCATGVFEGHSGNSGNMGRLELFQGTRLIKKYPSGFFIDLPFAGIFEMEILNLNGAVIKKFHQAKAGAFPILTGSNSKGVYFVHIRWNGISKTEKLVKM